MKSNFKEFLIEQAARNWLQGLGDSDACKPDIACDMLLPKLMSGEVRAKDVDEEL